MPEVTIISEEQIPQYLPTGEAVIMIAVTYTAENRPPRTVWIDKAKYSTELVRQAIKADMARAVTEAPKRLEI